MTDSLRAARLARENRQKWWSHHIPLAYAVLISAFLAIYLGFALVDRHITGWIANHGVSPSGINLLFGTVMCFAGILGLSKGKRLGAGWTFQFGLLVVAGLLALAKAFAFI